jgi:hypothetical protein
VRVVVSTARIVLQQSAPHPALRADQPGPLACAPTGVRRLAATPLESPAHPASGRGKQLRTPRCLFDAI